MKYLTEKEQKKLKQYLESAQEIICGRMIFFAEKAAQSRSEQQEAKYEDAEGFLEEFVSELDDLLEHTEELDNSIND